MMKGFNPKGIFVANLKFVGYSNLSKIFTPYEIEQNPNSPETVLSSIVQYKKLKECKGWIRQRL